MTSRGVTGHVRLTGPAGMRVRGRDADQDSVFSMISGAVQSTLTSASAALTGVPMADANAERRARTDKVIWTSFQTVDQGPADDTGSVGALQVLVVGYVNGWQVWDVSDSTHFHEIASCRDGPVKFAHMVAAPSLHEYGADPFANARPLIALVSDDPRAPNTVVMHSLRQHKAVHELKFRYMIYGIASNRRVVVVSTRKWIYVCDADSLRLRFAFDDCYPSPRTAVNVNPFALGSRYIASTGRRPMARRPHNSRPVSAKPAASTNNATTPTTTTAPPAAAASPTSSSHGRPSVGSGVSSETYRTFAEDDGDDDPHVSIVSQASRVANTLLSWGDMGMQRVVSYLGSEHGPNGTDSTAAGGASASARPTSSTTASALSQAPQAQADVELFEGTVIVRDIELSDDSKVVVNFGAMRHPISAMAFDPSGTLLVTASTHGHGFNVFQLAPSKQQLDVPSRRTAPHVDVQVRQLYKLRRGITSAVVQGICFSPDSRWVTVTTTRGTSHVYPILPRGGSSTATTHIPHRLPNDDHAGVELLNHRPPPLVTVHALTRIHQSPYKADHDDLALLAAAAAAAATTTHTTVSARGEGGRGNAGGRSRQAAARPHLNPMPDDDAALAQSRVYAPTAAVSSAAAAVLKMPRTRRVNMLSNMVTQVSAVFVRGAPGGAPRLLVAAYDGTVRSYELAPHKVERSQDTRSPASRRANASSAASRLLAAVSSVAALRGTAASSLALNCRRVLEWDVCRQREWAMVQMNADLVFGPTVTPTGQPLVGARGGTVARNEYNGNGTTTTVVRAEGSESNAWRRHAVIESYPSSSRPLWMGPQFTFKVYDGSDSSTVPDEPVPFITAQRALNSEQEFDLRSALVNPIVGGKGGHDDDDDDDNEDWLADAWKHQSNSSARSGLDATETLFDLADGVVRKSTNGDSAREATTSGGAPRRRHRFAGTTSMGAGSFYGSHSTMMLMEEDSDGDGRVAGGRQARASDQYDDESDSTDGEDDDDDIHDGMYATGDGPPSLSPVVLDDDGQYSVCLAGADTDDDDDAYDTDTIDIDSL